MKATIFDIQRFSVHDGPGIRTTVFFKGCPLRCRWCHNPEGLCREPQLQFQKEDCIGCGRCKDRAALTDAENCPTGALHVCGREAATEALLREVLRDRDFYGGEGGVTCSGGECLLQADAVAELLRCAKAEGLHTAIDTSGCVPWSAIEKTLDVCDLYLYDIKCADPQLHRAYTGHDNTLILDNLRRLSALGAPIHLRVPVIPGFNDDDEAMTAIAAIAEQIPDAPVTLIPYHALGVSKYASLGMAYTMDGIAPISPDRLAALERMFQKKQSNRSRKEIT